MDFYKRRSIVQQEVKEHLALREAVMERGENPPPFYAFINKMVARYGATKSMIKEFVEDLAPGATVKDGDIVKKE